MAKTRLPQTLGERISSLNLAEQLATITTGDTPDPPKELQEPTYYDYPVLQEPLWHWEIYWYFFFGGLAAGCYIIATIASLFASPEDRVITRTGYYLSLLAFLPCPPLLIKDLGRPERFLHMLRIVKVRSPMSMGTWAVVVFSLFCGLSTAIQAARDGILGRWFVPKLLAVLPQGLLALPGIFAGFFLGSYTGVLLAATSIPVWSRSRLLGAIFLSSAVSTSTALITLVLHIFRAPASVLHKLDRLEWAALLLEMTGLLAFLRGSGRAARPLVGTGPNEQGAQFWGLVLGSGLALPWLVKTFLLFGRRSHNNLISIPPYISHKRGIDETWRNAFQVLPSLLVIIGGFFLRRTLVKAGHTSSQDARTTLWNAKR
jgi:formate-dependent nitrite reductase membrane component NrfD